MKVEGKNITFVDYAPNGMTVKEFLDSLKTADASKEKTPEEVRKMFTFDINKAKGNYQYNLDNNIVKDQSYISVSESKKKKK